MKLDKRQVELERLHSRIGRCRKCSLHRSRCHAVPGEGPCSTEIVFIGEAPGKEEDRQGRPFTGRSGIELNKILSNTGISRERVFITSSVKCRPAHNRNPHSKELKTCKINWLDKQITIIQPRIVILLGKISLKQVLGIKVSLGKVHGNIYRREGRIYMVTYHPAAAMRNPEIKRRMENDMKLLSSSNLRSVP